MVITFQGSDRYSAFDVLFNPNQWSNSVTNNFPLLNDVNDFVGKVTCPVNNECNYIPEPFTTECGKTKDEDCQKLYGKDWKCIKKDGIGCRVLMGEQRCLCSKI